MLRWFDEGATFLNSGLRLLDRWLEYLLPVRNRISTLAASTMIFETRSLTSRPRVAQLPDAEQRPSVPG
jgi:hypothetical protein